MDRVTGRMDIACKYGLDVAVFVHNIVFWTEKNAANRNNFHDGRYWTHNSLDAFAALYPIWSRDQIKRIIAKCKDKGLLLTGDFNENPYDRTKWYSPSDDLLRFYDIEITPEGIWRNRPIERANGEIATCTYGEIATCNKVQDNTQIIPPISPKKKDALFRNFWDAYPKKWGKRDAKAAWDELSPDLELCRVMAKALKKQKSSEQWKSEGGRYIPRPADWIKDRRWEITQPDETTDIPTPRRYIGTEIIDGEECDIYG